MSFSSFCIFPRISSIPEKIDFFLSIFSISVRRFLYSEVVPPMRCVWLFSLPFPPRTPI